MQVNQARTLALSALAVTLLFVATAGARQGGNASTQSQEATAPSPPVKAKTAGPGTSTPAPAAHQHGAPATAKAPAAGAEVKGKYMTIVGEVMDPACFLEAGAKSIGPGHYQCAIDCAKSGQTLAIYSRDEDRIYMIAGELPGKNPNDPLMPYIHKKVDVSGTVYHRSGAYGIVITKVVPHEEKPAGAEKAEAGESGGATKIDAAGQGTGTPTTGAPAGK